MPATKTNSKGKQGGVFWKGELEINEDQEGD